MDDSEFQRGGTGHTDSGKTSLGTTACDIYSVHETAGRSYDKVHYLEK